MNRKRKGSWRFRRPLMLGVMFFCLAIIAQQVYSHKPEAAVVVSCDQASAIMPEAVPSLPDSHYLYSERYGWFDRSHFNTGRPEQVLADVHTAVSHGGGVVTISQGVRDNITGYAAAYYVSGNLDETSVLAAALGIYLDWSLRFEAWQAQPPHGLAGPLTSFAIEDLPSQYLGFYAQAHQISMAQLFACYLGPVSGFEEGPPDFVRAAETVAEDGWAGVARLQNKMFSPMVETAEGWQHVNWPAPLHMEPVMASPDTWLFIFEDTWFWGDNKLFKNSEFLRAFPGRRLPQ